MKIRKELKGNSTKQPEDKRSNFVEVPAMMKPIPAPKVKAECTQANEQKL